VDRGYCGETRFPYLASFARTSKTIRRRCQRRRTFLREDLASRVAVARVPRRRERGRRRRAKFRGGYARKTENARAREREREREREKTGMSLPLKKSCPNKGALFHAQCTPSQTRSLRYLSPRNARCSQCLLLSAPHRPSSPFPSLSSSSRPSRTARRSLWFFALPPVKRSARVSERAATCLPVTDCDNSLISLDVPCHRAAR